MKNRGDHNSWLHAQITLWMKEGLLEQATADTLLERYPVNKGSSRGLSLLSVLGAIIFGLGIILFFAFNWSELSKALKLTLIFAMLFLSHGIALAMRIFRNAPSSLTEGLHLLGTMMFGAGIWLIAQIYHMDEHYPTAFLLWGMGALVFAWTLPSTYQAMLAWLLITVWGTSEIMDFQQIHFYSVVLIAFGVLPIAWLHRSTLLLFASLLSIIVLSLLSIKDYVNAAAVFYSIAALATLLIAIAYTVDRTNFPSSGNVLRVLGVPVYALCLFVMTFVEAKDVVDTQLVSQEELSTLALILTWALLITASLVWVGILLRSLISRKSGQTSVTLTLQHALVLASLAVLLAQAAGLFNVTSGTSTFWQIGTLLYNAILTAHCVLLIIRGTDDQQWKLVAIGCIALSALLFARFNDLFQSLLVRSAVFLLLGAMLFLVGHLYSRKREAIQQKRGAVDA